MPASIKLKQLYGDDLAVIFVESQGHDMETVESFAWRRKWMGAGALWTTERPVEVEGNTIPKFALLGADGALLHKGNPLAMKKQIEESIATEVKKGKDAPAGTPASLKKAWSAFAKDDFAGALAECDKVAASDPDAAKAAREAFMARFESRLRRAKWRLDNGQVASGVKALAALAKSSKGCELASQVAEQSARIEAEPALKTELAAGEALDKLLEKMVEDKPFEEGLVKALGKLAEKHAGTKAAARAAHLVELSKLNPDK